MNLDPQQEAAAYSSAPMVLCLAGAGSGKTRVVVERIAHLVHDCQVSPYEIMAVSFTRKASSELRHRIKERIGGAAGRIQMGTIHAIALRYLRRFGEMIGLRGQNLTVYSEWESEYLLREVAIDLGIYKGKAWKIPRRETQAVFDAYYQEGALPEEDHPCRRIFDEFMARCRENNSLTYGGILKSFDTIIPKISPYLPLKHIFVDEAQDLDRLQWRIFDTLVLLGRAQLFVVGDIDQSIYSWRGAVPEYLIGRQGNFQVYRIENNYRSRPQIVEAANRLIEHNTARIPRTMRPVREDDALVQVLTGQDTQSAAQWSLGCSDPHNVAFLARNHLLLKKLAAKMDELGAPYTYVGRTAELVESQLFRVFHAFLKLTVNPYDNFSLLLIREQLGIGRQEYNDIRLRATQESKGHFQVWLHDGSEAARWWYCWQSEPFNIFMRELVNFDWPNDILPVVRFIEDWAEENPEKNINDYLQWLATYDVQDEIREDDQHLKLMTIHAAKGLEWPVVVLLGCNEGILPSKQSIEAEDVEAERRLMYVACTRAKDSLILAVRPEEKIDERGKIYSNPVSRFIGEMIP